MLKSCVWTVAAIGLWIAGLGFTPKHREIWTIEEGQRIMRVTMPSPSAATLGLWMLATIAAVQGARCAVKVRR